jgi:hypothetical protein
MHTHGDYYRAHTSSVISHPQQATSYLGEEVVHLVGEVLRLSLCLGRHSLRLRQRFSNCRVHGLSGCYLLLQGTLPRQRLVKLRPQRAVERSKVSEEATTMSHTADTSGTVPGLLLRLLTVLLRECELAVVRLVDRMVVLNL